MVKTLLSYIKDSQHALETFCDFNFLGQNKLIFTKDIIIFYPIVPYPKLLHSNLSYFILLWLYYKSTSLSLSSLSRFFILSLKQFVKVVPLSRIGFVSFKRKFISSMAKQKWKKAT